MKPFNADDIIASQVPEDAKTNVRKALGFCPLVMTPFSCFSAKGWAGLHFLMPHLLNQKQDYLCVTLY